MKRMIEILQIRIYNNVFKTAQFIQTQVYTK